jgi:hypothetical protein
MKEPGSVDIVDEKRENKDALAKLLSLLWLSDEDYFSDRLQSMRSQRISNSTKVLHTIKKLPGGKYVLQKSFSVIPEESGTVPRISIDKLYNSTGMFVLFVDNQWDLWLGEAVSSGEEQVAKSMIKSLPPSQEPAVRLDDLDAVVFGEQIRVIRQGYERSIFSSHFESDWRLGENVVRQRVRAVLCN